MSTQTPRIGWTDLATLGQPTHRILVVEDDRDTAKALKRLVQAMGHDVRVADSAEAADQWISQGTIDLILLDVHLPRMNGLEFLHWALRRSPTTAVVMVTGHDDADAAIECMRQGARTYLVKPVDPEILKIVVTDALAVRKLLLAFRSHG